MYLNFDDLEISVEDGNAPIKLVFIPDYVGRDKLHSRKLQITAWQRFAISVIKQELKHNDNYHGVTFIRRRMIKYGLGLLEKDNEQAINILSNRYESFLSSFNSKQFNTFYQNTLTIGDTRFHGEKINIYLEDEDLGRINELSEILHISQRSIMRISLVYTIDILDCFDGIDVTNDNEDIRMYVKDDIEAFKAKLNELSLH